MARHGRDGDEIWCGRIGTPGPSRTTVHEYSAIVLHLAGRMWITQDGSWEAVPGDVRLVPAGTPHAHTDAEAPELLGVAFCAACVRAAGLGEVLAPFEAVRRGRSPLFRPPPDVSARVQALLELLEEECRRDAPGSARARRALLELVLVELCRLGDAARVPATGGIVADALAWIEAHAFEDITPRSVAAALRRSSTHLTTAVREQTGRTVGQWIVDLRMAEARRRLRDTDERIDVIGERVGYADPSHFSRVFKRAHGTSPSAWRLDAGLSASRPARR